MAAVVVESHSDCGSYGSVRATTWWWKNNQWDRAWVREMRLKEENEIESNNTRKRNQKQWCREQNRNWNETK